MALEGRDLRPLEDEVILRRFATKHAVIYSRTGNTA